MTIAFPDRLRKRRDDPDLTYYLDSIQFGHADVDYDNIRFKFSCLLCGLTTIRRLANHSPSVLGLEDRECATPHQLVIISYQNSKFFHIRPREASSREPLFPD